MIYFWLFQLTSLLVLLVSRYLFEVSSEVSILLLSFVILLATPVILPIVQIIREDMTPMRSLFTRAGVVGFFSILLASLGLFFWLDISSGTFIFVLFSLLAVYFRFESRIFFLSALLGLIVTVSALTLKEASLAESASIVVYLALVIGVFVEIGSPWFDRLHQHSKPLITLSSEFKTNYQLALSDYAWMMTMILQSLFILALLGRGTLWNFEYQMLLYLAFGVWIFFTLYLLSSHRTLHIRDFVVNRLSKGYIISLFRGKRHYIKYILSGGVFATLVVLIDWTLIWRLPSITLASLVTLIILLIGVGVYGIVSIFYRR